nr:hypothetical protein [Oligoflexus tunisiensis]
MVSHVFLELNDFFQTPSMPIRTRKARFEIGHGQVLRQLNPDNPSPKDEYIHIVVLNALVGRIAVMGQAGPYAWDLVGGNGSPYPTPTKQNSTGARLNTFSNFHGIVWIVHGAFVIGTDIFNSETLCLKIFEQGKFQVKTCMVISQCDSYFAHLYCSLTQDNGFRLMKRTGITNGALSDHSECDLIHSRIPPGKNPKAKLKGGLVCQRSIASVCLKATQ